MATGQSSPTELFKDFSVRDWMVVGGGLVLFVFSFFDYVGLSVTIGSISEGGSIDAWHSYAILGLLLVLATSIAWGLQATKTATLPPLPAKFELIAAGAAGLGTLLILIRGLSYSSHLPGVSIGLRFGGVVVILAGAVVTAGAIWTHYDGASTSKR